MVKSQDDADDLTQDTFVRAYRGLKTFKEEFDFHPWLYRIAVNQAINFINRRKRQAAADSMRCRRLEVKSGPEPESPFSRLRAVSFWGGWNGRSIVFPKNREPCSSCAFKKGFPMRRSPSRWIPRKVR